MSAAVFLARHPAAWGEEARRRGGEEARRRAAAVGPQLRAGGDLEGCGCSGQVRGVAVGNCITAEHTGGALAASPGGIREYISGSFHDGVTAQMYSSYFTEEEWIRGTAEADETITGWSLNFALNLLWFSLTCVNKYNIEMKPSWTVKPVSFSRTKSTHGFSV